MHVPNTPLEFLKFLKALKLDSNKTLRLRMMIWMNFFALKRFEVEVLQGLKMLESIELH